MAHGVAHRLTDSETPSCRLLIAGAMDRRRKPASDRRQVYSAAVLHRRISRAANRFALASPPPTPPSAPTNSTRYERGAILDRAAAQIEKRAGRLRRNDASGSRLHAARRLRRNPAVDRHIQAFGGRGAPLRRRRHSARRRGWAERAYRLHAARAARRGLRDHAVQRPAQYGRPQGRAGACRRQRRRPQAFAAYADDVLHHGRVPDRGGPAARHDFRVHGDGEVAQWLLEEPLVRFYAFTGSTEVGGSSRTAPDCGGRRWSSARSRIASCDDADLDVALPKVINAGYRKAGQVCTSIQVLLVQRSLVDEVERRLAALVAALPYGDPADDKTVVGPVISEAAAQRIESWIALAIERGARRLQAASGAVPSSLRPCSPTSTAPRRSGCQEVFGPVMCIAAFDRLDEAIAQVNATPSAWRRHLHQTARYALLAARKLQVGGVHINETPSSRVDLMPYGGSKDSGFGREGPHYAIREMSEERMVTILA